MSFEEFQLKEMALYEKVLHLESNTCELEANIAFNKREMAQLRFEIKELHAEYAKTGFDCQIPNIGRNLQGESIGK